MPNLQDIIGVLMQQQAAPSRGVLSSLFRSKENETLEDQKRRAIAEALLRIPFYSTDSGRVQPFGNFTGQPSETNERGEGMYPSSARTQSVPNPLYSSTLSHKQNLLPPNIPADLKAILELI